MPHATETKEPQEIEELRRVVSQLPPAYQAKLELAVTETVTLIERRSRLLRLMQEAMSQLRLDIKYLLFDLEATRRERDGLRDPE